LDDRGGDFRLPGVERASERIGVELPQSLSDPGWADLKTQLSVYDRRALVALIRDLYDVSAENRRFLRARLLDSRAELATYRRQVADAVFPDPLSRRPVRLGEAQRLIRHFRRATEDVAGTVDLMLTLVEAGTEQAADLGYGDERYFTSLEGVIRDAVKALKTLPGESRERVVARLRRVANRGASIGWGYGDYLREVVAALPGRS